MTTFRELKGNTAQSRQLKIWTLTLLFFAGIFRQRYNFTPQFRTMPLVVWEYFGKTATSLAMCVSSD